ncbi:hypothetical protein J4460_04115 [Candidatus Woesearchaeota archaeon]|nr:hypothetical protein [Candidatus Woesearchaeota archaeon]HIH38095.1 hypothetical protein [Candidatus Woesearchaeota archaeon]HIH48357.1 hypothetical protein [Candidatus Woesearchaeota archaeon]HIJ03172.1 hypothetical protein [Candidatus Woesearchaeota archaeon]
MKGDILIVFVVFVLLAALVSANPILTAIPDRTVSEGSEVRIQLTATGADSGERSFLTNATSGRFSTAQFDETEGLFIWIPTYNDAGTYLINFTARDSNSSDNQLARIIVQNAIEPTLSFNKITLGGPTIERSNRRLNFESKVSQTFTIRNAGSRPVTNLSFFASPSPYDYNITFKAAVTSLAPGASAQVEIAARVPEALDAVDREQNAVPVLIGQVIASAKDPDNRDISQSVELSMQAKNHLRIIDVNAIINGKRKNADDGEIFHDIKPGDTIEIEVEVENNFPNDDALDFSIENVKVRADADDRYFKIDDYETMGTIRRDNSDKILFSYVVDDDVEDSTYDVVISATGRDENRANHGDKMSISFEVDIPSDYLTIYSSGASPESIGCARSTDIGVTILNSGDNKQRRAIIKLESAQLGIKETSGTFEVDTGDRATRSFHVKIPDDTSEGDYGIEAQVYYDTNVPSDGDIINVHVLPCSQDVVVNPPEESSGEPKEGSTQEEEPTESEIIEDIPEENASIAPGTNPLPVQPQGGDVLPYVGLLFVVVIILMVLAALLVNKMRRARR